MHQSELIRKNFRVCYDHRNDYIQLASGKYIDTGVSPSMYSGNYAVRLEEFHAANSADMYMFGTGASNTTEGARGNIRIDKNGLTCNVYVNTSTNGGAAVGLTATNQLVLNSRNYIKLDVSTTENRRSLQINDNSPIVANGKFSSSSTLNFKIGAYVSNAGSIVAKYTGKIYYLQIYGNGNLVRDFVPCQRISDGIFGFYDKVSGGFYSNAGGSGELTGPSA